MDWVDEAINKTIERLQGLHEYASRPAWEAVMREEMLCAIRKAKADGMREAADIVLDMSKWSAEYVAGCIEARAAEIEKGIK